MRPVARLLLPGGNQGSEIDLGWILREVACTHLCRQNQMKEA